MTYWHHWELRHPMREVAHWYPKTYAKTGEILKAANLLAANNPNQWEPEAIRSELLAIIAAVPGHVQPYKRSSGDPTPWALIDWQHILARFD